MKTNLSALAASLSSLLLVFGLSFSASTDSSPDFAFINETEPQTLDPGTMTGQPEGRIAQAIFEGLTVYHPETLEPLPGVATRWTVSPNGRELTFELRPDSYWVRGTERLRAVTPDDFIYSWRRLLEPETASEYYYILFPIRGAEDYYKWVQKFYADALKQLPPQTTLDDLPETDKDAHFAARNRRFEELVGLRAETSLDGHPQLVVSLAAPCPYFADLTCFYPLSPVQRECVEHATEEEPWTRPQSIVTNGSFTLESWRFNNKIRLARNKHYWDKANVGMATIDALAVEDMTTALNMYLKGTVHWIPQLPLSLMAKLQARSDYHNAPMLSVYFYRCNITKEPFIGESGKLLRQALVLAIDRDEICRNVTQSGELPAFNVVPQGIRGYQSSPGINLGDISRNRARAHELLIKAGFESKRPKLTLLYNTSERHKTIAAAVQAQWKEHLGIDVELVNQEWGTYLDTVQSKNYHVARAGWIGDYTDPNTFLDMWVTDGPQNNTGFTNPLYDRLIAYAADITKALDNGNPQAPLGRVKLLEDLPSAHPLVERCLAAIDPSERLRLETELRLLALQRADAMIADELPAIPLYFYTTNHLWHPELEGLHANLRDTHVAKFFRWKSSPPR